MTTGPSLPPPRPSGPPPPPPPSPWALPPGTYRPTPSPGLATAALVCGLVGLVMFFVLVPSVVALVLGLIAWRRARAAPGLGDARGRALAGWILGLIGVLGFVAIMVTAVATGDLDDDDTVGVRDLRAGQCIDVPDDEQIFEVPERECDEPHDAEVYAVRELDGVSYPGDEAVQQQAREVCSGDAFDEYFAVSFDESSLDVNYLWPTEDNWRDGDHDVVCAAANGNGRQLTRSMAGAGD